MTARLDTAEAIANASLGLLISITAVHLVWPLMGWPVTGGQSVTVAALFFALSTARSYALRRVFRRMDVRS